MIYINQKRISRPSTQDSATFAFKQIIHCRHYSLNSTYDFTIFFNRLHRQIIITFNLKSFGHIKKCKNWGTRIPKCTNMYNPIFVRTVYQVELCSFPSKKISEKANTEQEGLPSIGMGRNLTRMPQFPIPKKELKFLRIVPRGRGGATVRYRLHLEISILISCLFFCFLFPSICSIALLLFT